mgnify:CR=1 FL=1
MSFRVFEPSYDFIDESLNVFLGDRLSSVIAQVDGPLRVALLLYVVLYGFAILRGAIEGRDVLVVEANGERVAELPEELANIVTDREDRKWIAAARAAHKYLGLKAPIVYAAESDWLRVEETLKPYGIVFCRLLPRDWYKKD